MILTRCIVALLLSSTALLFPGVDTARADDAAAAPTLPRYRLVPGQRIVYEGDEIAIMGSGRLGLTRQTTVQVVRVNPDGSWRTIIEQRHQRFNERGGERTDYPPRRDLLIVDVHPDGRIPTRASDTFGILDRMFPVLPPDSKALAAGWTFRSGDLTHHARRVEDEDGAFAFEIEPSSDMMTLSGFGATWRHGLDPATGAIAGHDVQHRHEERDTRAGSERITSVETIDAETLTALAGDIDLYTTTEAAYRAAVRDATALGDVATAGRRLDAASALLTGAQAQLTSDLFSNEVEHMGRGHAAMRERYLQGVQAQAHLIDHAAPPWSHVDLAGNTHRLEDYRGRIVVLDFWYRRCGWCMRAMPQIIELARDYDGRPVAVLGMNVDKERPDAEFVVDHFKPPYPTIISDRNLARSYGARGFPTVVLLDQTGAIRRVHVGHSATLKDDLAREIEALLADPPGAR